MHEPLKNCPFCGGAPTTIERPDNIDGTQFFYAIACYCGRHSACAHKMAVRKTPEIAKADAVAAWNTRTPQPTHPQAGAVPLTPEKIAEIADAAHREYDRLVASGQCAPRWSAVFAHFLEQHHGIGIKGGQHGSNT